MRNLRDWRRIRAIHRNFASYIGGIIQGSSWSGRSSPGTRTTHRPPYDQADRATSDSCSRSSVPFHLSVEKDTQPELWEVAKNNGRAHSKHHPNGLAHQGGFLV